MRDNFVIRGQLVVGSGGLWGLVVVEGSFGAQVRSFKRAICDRRSLFLGRWRLGEIRKQVAETNNARLGHEGRRKTKGSRWEESSVRASRSAALSGGLNGRSRDDRAGAAGIMNDAKTALAALGGRDGQ